MERPGPAGSMPQACALSRNQAKRPGRWARLAGRWASLAGLLPAMAALLLALAGTASAGVVAHVDLSRQRMMVAVNGVPSYSWPVSTARRGYVTPTGSYRPQRMHVRYFSKKYYNSPMPHAIFFRGGYAIHGSYAVNQLGSPASHGCIRLHPGHAATLFRLVRTYGSGNTVIRITR